MRALLLKGAKRSALNSKRESCISMIKDNVQNSMKQELNQMLTEPSYIECFMVRTPLVPLKKNHKT